jgi:serine/threonine protein kinase
VNVDRIGPYEVIRELGTGSFAVVFLAERPGLLRSLAVKVFADIGNAEAEQRFLREARLASALDHPGIVGCFDMGQDPHTGWLYLALDYAPGGSLEERLEARGAMPVAEALALALRVAEALAFAHGEGVLHRDVKPANILFAASGQPKLSDFGLAASQAEARLTRSDACVGTPLYMAPEQFSGGRTLDPRVDVYSLGVVLYRMLTGRAPYQAQNVFDLAKLAEAGQPTPPSHLRPDLAPGVEALCLRAMARAPRDRFPTMSAVVDALREALTEEAEGGARTSDTIRSASRTARTPKAAAPRVRGS